MDTINLEIISFYNEDNNNLIITILTAETRRGETEI